MAGKVSSNPNEFLLPDVGEGLESADLVEWKVKVGEKVESQQVIAMVETAKALTEICADRDGTVAILHGKPGDTIAVHAPFVTYEGANGASPTTKPENGKATKEPLAASRNNNVSEPEERADAGTVVGSLSGADYSAVDGKVRAAPAVRRSARDLGVDIETVRGTGIGGRVTLRDVENAAHGAKTLRAAPQRRSNKLELNDFPASTPGRAGPASAPAPKRQQTTIPSGQDVLRTPFKGVRRVIAERLSQSVHTAVHFTVMDEADITDLDQFRRRLIGATGEKLSYLPFVAAAVCMALREPDYQRMNSTVDDPNQEIITHRSVHLGIATDTESGLMVPVIRDAGAMGVVQLSRQIAAVAAAARSRTIAREDLTGSTFTISNVGSLAGRFATPIINYPEVGILAVGRARDGVVVRNKMLGVGKILPLSLSCDHRVIDGGMAALLLARVIELLQSPEQLIPAD
jgi:pyruvate dehydrogenase E2 component (dihydrolipoamide acetyltransferase)